MTNNIFILSILFCFIFSSYSQASWNGGYSCELYFGRTVADQPIIITYSLEVKDNDCFLSMDGYQTYNRMICSYESKPDALSIYFEKYPSSAFSSNVYKKHDLLFELERKGSVLHTKWKKLDSEMMQYAVEPESCFKYE